MFEGIRERFFEGITGNISKRTDEVIIHERLPEVVQEKKYLCRIAILEKLSKEVQGKNLKKILPSLELERILREITKQMPRKLYARICRRIS